MLCIINSNYSWLKYILQYTLHHCTNLCVHGTLRMFETTNAQTLVTGFDICRQLYQNVNTKLLGLLFWLVQLINNSLQSWVFSHFELFHNYVRNSFTNIVHKNFVTSKYHNLDLSFMILNHYRSILNLGESWILVIL